MTMGVIEWMTLQHVMQFRRHCTCIEPCLAEPEGWTTSERRYIVTNDVLIPHWYFHTLNDEMRNLDVSAVL